MLQDVHLEIPDGEVAAIVGGNGSGKSTLLRLLAGVSRPTRGTVSGRPEVIGYVPDRFPPNERLSAMEYLTHLGRIRGLATRTAIAKADQLVDRLALVGGKHSPLRTLSKGNAQKIALAQALLVAPQLLVLDEPWSGLDASAHGVLGDIIAEVAGAGGMVVFTDHRESITSAYASRTYVTASGKVSRSRTDRGIDSSSTAELVLAHPRGSAKPHNVDWYTLEGVLDVTDQVETIIMRVSREHTDALLLTALQHGWSVTCLGPIEESTGKPSATVNRNSR
ncbi:MAG: ATP-binding cassette domain-containing protein [Pseudonocardiaceae bacterium]